MTIVLPPDLQAFVDDLVSSGEFVSSNDVLEKALRLLKSERERVLAMIQVGIDDLDAGRSRDGEEVMRELAARFAPDEAVKAA